MVVAVLVAALTTTALGHDGWHDGKLQCVMVVVLDQRGVRCRGPGVGVSNGWWHLLIEMVFWYCGSGVFFSLARGIKCWFSVCPGGSTGLVEAHGSLLSGWCCLSERCCYARRLTRLVGKTLQDKTCNSPWSPPGVWCQVYTSYIMHLSFLQAISNTGNS